MSKMYKSMTPCTVFKKIILKIEQHVSEQHFKILAMIKTWGDISKSVE